MPPAKPAAPAPAAKPAAPAPAAKPAAPTPPAQPGSQTVDLSKSSVSATYKQTGVSADGQFKKFTVAVDFNPANPAQTKAQVDVDMSSFDLGDPAYNVEMVKKEWFNTAQYPKATFVSTAVKASAPGKLDVTGKLTLKGKTADLTFPVTYKQDGANTVVEGMVPIKRLAFNVGEGEWKDTEALDDEIRIKFKFTLAPRK
jgi:polyisoprenoid-binding protein YceI